MTPTEYLDVYKVKPCLDDMPRKDVTDLLSKALEVLVLHRRNALACWAAEVKLSQDSKRVDYIDFCPHPRISCCSQGSVERGIFRFFDHI